MKNPEVLWPVLLAAPTTIGLLIRDILPDWISARLYELRKNGKPMGFTESLEEIILDELEVFDQCPGKNTSDNKFSIERSSRSTKYRLFVADDFLGETVGRPRLLMAETCHVGVPYNVFYKSVDDVANDIDRWDLNWKRDEWPIWTRIVSKLFGGRTSGGKKGESNVEWGSEDGVKLMESLVLTDPEKRFLIQRLIQEADIVSSPGYEIMAIAGPLLAAGFANFGYRRYVEFTYGLNRTVNRRRLLPFYIATTLVAIYAVNPCRIFMRNYLDIASDRTTARIGEKYARGGVDYYRKLMERHRAINRLSNGRSRSFYAQDGDYVGTKFLRTPMTKLKDRIETLEQILNEKEIQQQST